jgi:hypothetical protein
MAIGTIAVSVLSSGIVSGVMVAYFGEQVKYKAWDRQQRWTAKHGMYRESLQSLHALFLAVATKDAYGTHAPHTAETETANKDFIQAYMSFDTVRQVAALTIGEEGFRILQDLSLDADVSAATHVQAVRTTIQSFILAARKELDYEVVSFDDVKK